MSSAIVPHIANVITSQKLLKLKRMLAERKRGLRKSPHVVTVYLRLNDAYSYVLLQVLDKFKERYSMQYDFRTILHLQSEMYPAPCLWANNAFSDGLYLAELYSLDFPDLPPKSTPERDAQLTAQLLHWELQPGYLENALRLFQSYWEGDEFTISRLVDDNVLQHAECYQHHVRENESQLKRSGHYLSAMLHYGGEWYWGLDRLEHLELRLNGMGLDQSGKQTVVFNKGYRKFSGLAGKVPKIKPTIELFWSIRSPYSYLGLVRAIQLAEHYQVALEIKPVLPMVMRRMQVPKNKRFYILLDTKREAKKYGIKFGRVADPIGEGVERCYALYEYAKAEGKAVAYLESYARGVWSEGVRSETDKGLKIIVERVGLSWQKAKGLLQDDSWKEWAQQNLSDLYANNQWGVPSFKYGDLVVFGQDRINRIEQAILKDIDLVT